MLDALGSVSGPVLSETDPLATLLRRTIDDDRYALARRAGNSRRIIFVSFALDLYGAFSVKRLFWVCCQFFVRSAKAVLRHVACDQVRGGTMNREMGLFEALASGGAYLSEGSSPLGASSRRTLVCGRSVWIPTMMQSCASAAKLRAAGPFSPSAFGAMSAAGSRHLGSLIGSPP